MIVINCSKLIFSNTKWRWLRQFLTTLLMVIKKRAFFSIFSFLWPVRTYYMVTYFKSLRSKLSLISVLEARLGALQSLEDKFNLNLGYSHINSRWQWGRGWQVACLVSKEQACLVTRWVTSSATTTIITTTHTVSQLQLLPQCSQLWVVAHSLEPPLLYLIQRLSQKQGHPWSTFKQQLNITFQQS